VVLGGNSAPLDVGRAERLVTDEVRAALIARDRGCVFPGCDAPPSRCEAHHIIPWWAGGVTALHNLVLLCHSHHPIIEPARHGIRDQWQVQTATDGLPEFTPPTRLDPTRKTLRHHRHPHPPREGENGASGQAGGSGPPGNAGDPDYCRTDTPGTGPPCAA
jgi:hypothetical protein